MPTAPRAPRRAPVLLLLLLAAPAHSTLAQDAPPVQPLQGQELHPWTLRFEPAAWYPAASGEIRMPGADSDDLEVADLNLDSPRLSPAGELHFRRDRWRITAEAFDFSTGNRGAVMTDSGAFGTLDFTEGDRLSSSLDLTNISLQGAYRLRLDEAGVTLDGGTRLRSSIFAVGGARFLDVEAGAELDGTSISRSAIAAHPLAGLRWELDIWEEFAVDLLMAGGYFPAGNNSSYSFDILVGFAWNPTPALGAQIGYRQLLFEIQDGEGVDEFNWQGGLAGVYAGAVLRF